MTAGMIILDSIIKNKPKELLTSSIRCSKPVVRLQVRCCYPNSAQLQTLSSIIRILKQVLSAMTNNKGIHAANTHVSVEKRRERERDYRFSMHVKQRVRSWFHSLLSEINDLCFCTSQLLSKAGHGNNCNRLT